MSDERPADQERLWRQLREVSPPPGARQRVMDAMESRLARPRRLWVPAMAAAAAALAIVWWPETPDSRRAQVTSASGVSQAGQALSGGDAVGAGPIEVTEIGHLDVRLDTAQVSTKGPASLEIARESVILRAGDLDIDGQIAIEGAGCTAEIDGQSEVSVTDAHLEVRVFSGSVEIASAEMTCEVIDMTEHASAARQRAAPARSSREQAPRSAPTRGSDGGDAVEPVEPVAVQVNQPESEPDDTRSAPAEPAREPAPIEPVREPAPPQRAAPARAPTPAPSAPPVKSELSRQVDAYWDAIRSRKSDPEQALRRLRAMVKQWPDSSLRPEIELAIFDTLIELGDAAGARRQARHILARYPDTPRADELRRTIGEGGDAP